ncbi:hypothetical protein ILYODFUR_027838 [Ilyodon furcidens]|uniref:Tc1-like transposase DDE domain-containing protein n=1 Tax=Ilyodon furcidens TaxID=33524 RepID=A0ABV0TP69_9TELE
MVTSSRTRQHVTKLNITRWFVEYDVLTVLQWPLLSPDLNPIEHLRDAVEEKNWINRGICSNCGTALSQSGSESLKGCFQHPLGSTPQRNKKVWKQKAVQPDSIDK